MGRHHKAPQFMAKNYIHTSALVRNGSLITPCLNHIFALKSHQLQNYKYGMFVHMKIITDNKTMCNRSLLYVVEITHTAT